MLGATIKMMCYSFCNILSTNKVAMLCYVDVLCLLNCIVATVQVTEGRLRLAGRMLVSPGLKD